MGFSRRHAVKALVGVFGSTALFVAHAQSRKSGIPVIGLLTANRISDSEINAIRSGLKDAGYLDDTHFSIDQLSADSQYDRLPGLASQLVERHVAVIVAIGGTVSAMAAKGATTTIPILFTTAGDPVKLGLVAGLRQPGGNLTGVTFLGAGLGGKRLELLRQMVPTAKVVGFLVNPANPSLASERKEVEAAAQAFGQRILVENANDIPHIDAAFANFSEHRVDAIILAADAVYTGRRQQITALATRYRIPAIYPLREFVTAGGLASYGASRTEAYVLLGRYAGRILKGERPGELPVQQSTKVDLAVNLTAAKILGLKLPSTFLARADEVIE